ncbi:hypothetical protein EVAR_32547_1 [Eumeta japonica]|uniref:Uncharacterized protein n=1 Tax=Eumeta variegata TaxID=151549 RepID=A0A4C1VTF0_EUMVA|nr:hypothetical protein EVAR_32547_1 [Eumeta japonica]
MKLYPLLLSITGLRSSNECINLTICVRTSFYGDDRRQHQCGVAHDRGWLAYTIRRADKSDLPADLNKLRHRYESTPTSQHAILNLFPKIKGELRGKQFKHAEEAVAAYEKTVEATYK